LAGRAEGFRERTPGAGEHAPAALKDRLRRSIRATVIEQAEVKVESGADGTVVEVRSTRIERRG
jgi:hypothetical protein